MEANRRISKVVICSRTVIPPMTQPLTPATAPDKGVIARAIGVITSPRATFETVVAYPRPAAISLPGVSAARRRAGGAAVHRALPAGGARHAKIKSMESFGMQVTPEMYQGDGKADGVTTATSRWSRCSHLRPAGVAVVRRALLGPVQGDSRGRGHLQTGIGDRHALAVVIGALGALVSAPIMYTRRA